MLNAVAVPGCALWTSANGYPSVWKCKTAASLQQPLSPVGETSKHLYSKAFQRYLKVHSWPSVCGMWLKFAQLWLGSPTYFQDFSFNVYCDVVRNWASFYFSVLFFNVLLMLMTRGHRWASVLKKKKVAHFLYLYVYRCYHYLHMFFPTSRKKHLEAAWKGFRHESLLHYACCFPWYLKYVYDVHHNALSS